MIFCSFIIPEDKMENNVLLKSQQNINRRKLFKRLYVINANSNLEIKFAKHQDFY